MTGSTKGDVTGRNTTTYNKRASVPLSSLSDRGDLTLIDRPQSYWALCASAAVVVCGTWSLDAAAAAAAADD